MKRERSGKFVTISTVGEKCRAFVPDPLPPVPPLKITPRIQDLTDRALLALGGLSFAAKLLPDLPLFLYMYVRKEAVLSSQIEGTQSSLSDLLRYEAAAAPGVPPGDIREVSNYVAAMDHGMKRVRKGFPLSLRLIREIHGVLLSKGRGSDKSPGEFRRSQNWIGGTRPGNAVFVPPPPDRLMECMGSLEQFLHDRPRKTPVLLKAALSHVQFETIHPFLDGNGRVGRLLITLMLCAENILCDPLLYLSLFFKSHRQDYYSLLNGVRNGGDWESWIEFFMAAVKETSEQALDTIRAVSEMTHEHRKKIENLGKPAATALQVHRAMLNQPFMTISSAAEKTGISFPAVNGAVKHLEDLGIAREITGKSRKRIYIYEQYINILNEGTEPI